MNCNNNNNMGDTQHIGSILAITKFLCAGREESTAVDAGMKIDKLRVHPTSIFAIDCGEHIDTVWQMERNRVWSLNSRHSRAYLTLAIPYLALSPIK
jgi:hypothetical protein